jgi:hypothetical protein
MKVKLPRAPHPAPPLRPDCTSRESRDDESLALASQRANCVAGHGASGFAKAKSAPQARIYLDNSTITGADVQPGFHPEARYEFKGTSTELILKT